MTMSDRIAVMNHGQYEQLGDPASLYERPRTRFVAGFLGVSNLLADDPRGHRRRLRRSRSSPTARAVRVPAALTEGLDSYEIGVRPEKIRLLELTDPGPRRRQPAARHRPRRVVPRRLDELHRRDARRRVDHGLRAERPARDPRRAVGAGRRGPAGLLADPYVRGRGRRGAAARRPRSRASSRRAVRRSRRPRPASRAGGSSSAAPSRSPRSASGPSSPPPPGKGTSAGPVAQHRAGIVDARRQPPRAVRGMRPPRAEASAEPIASLPPATGTLRFANWEGYMDIDEETKRLPDARAASPRRPGSRSTTSRPSTGTRPSSRPSWPARSEPGLPTEWDLIVMTDWMIARLIRLGWLETTRPDAELPGQPARHLPRPLVRPGHEPRGAVSVRA